MYNICFEIYHSFFSCPFFSKPDEIPVGQLKIGKKKDTDKILISLEFHFAANFIKCIRIELDWLNSMAKVTYSISFCIYCTLICCFNFTYNLNKQSNNNNKQTNVYSEWDRFYLQLTIDVAKQLFKDRSGRLTVKKNNHNKATNWERRRRRRKN